MAFSFVSTDGLAHGIADVDESTYGTTCITLTLINQPLSTQGIADLVAFLNSLVPSETLPPPVVAS